MMNYKYLKLFSSALLLSFFQGALVASFKPAMFSILSWNILGPNTQDVDSIRDGRTFNKGDYRRIKDEVVKEITNLNNPYILCLQEVDEESRKILNEAFKGLYEEAGYYKKGANGGVVLFVKNKTFKILSVKAVSLEGGLNQGANRKNTGAAVIACLKSEKTGSLFTVVCLHLDKGEVDDKEGQTQINKLLGQVIEAEKIVPSKNERIYRIFAGDFNTTPGSLQRSLLPIIQEFNTKNYLTLFDTNSVTVQNPIRGANNSFKTVDYILVPDDLKSTDYSKIAGYKDGLIVTGVPSDHAILYGVFFDPVDEIPVTKAPAAQSSSSTPNQPKQSGSSNEGVLQSIKNDLKEGYEKLKSYF